MSQIYIRSYKFMLRHIFYVHTQYKFIQNIWKGKFLEIDLQAI